MKKTIDTLILLMSLSLPLTAQTIVHVAPSGTGNGSSWANAAGNLKTVLDNAVSGTQIWVKEGTYKPANCSNCTFEDRNKRFQVPNGVKVYGGFGGFETELDQRNWVAHPTILSGDINNDETLAHNAFNVVFTQNVSALTVVDGFTITGGNADQTSSAPGTPQTSGAGWFNVGSTNGASSHPVINNCTFTSNYAFGYGGGFFNDGSFGGATNPMLTNCVFSNNTAVNGGGAAYNTGAFGGNCNPVFQDCDFLNNTCEMSDGGAMVNLGPEDGTCNPTLNNCTFISNTADNDGGAVYNFGKNGNSSPAFTACIFEGNVSGAGGAVYSDGTFGGYSGAQYTDCQFIDNSTTEGDGGAMYNSAYLGTCSPFIVNCLFDHNESLFGGGAIFNNGGQGVSNPTITNSRFVGNIADTYGAAIYNQGQSGNASPYITNCIFQENSALSAGAIYNLGADNGNANASITNCTFYGNHANVGGAVYCNAGEQGTGTASPSLRNCIFWGNYAENEGDIFRIIWGTPNISYSLVDKANCASLYNGNGGTVNCGAGMKYNQDPMFVSPASGNFHLSADASPAVDDGSNEATIQTNVLVDLDSLPRIFNSTVDMGVYEFGSMLGNAPAIVQQPASLEVCQNTAATFSVSATGSQPLSYQWMKNGANIGGATQSVFSIPNTALGDAGDYTCMVSNSTGTIALSDVASLTVNTLATVALSISASQTEVCAGEPVIFSAMPSNGGAAPIFQWSINGNAFGGNIQTFNISSLNDGDTFTCQVTSSETCVISPVAVSNPVSINVESVLTASLSIAANATAICEGQTVTFTASPVNGGNTPLYQWLLNGANIGDNSPQFSANSLQSGDAVQCRMTSSKNCVLVNPVFSNTVTMGQVSPNLTASLSIIPSVESPFCKGTAVTFTANPQNGGSAPSYEWLVNGTTAGGNSASFTTTVLEHEDVVVCYLTSSEACLTANPVLSNAIIVSVDSCSLASGETGEEMGISVYPNPASDKFFVQLNVPGITFALRLIDVHGNKLLTTPETRLNAPLELNTSHLPRGIYYLQIISNGRLSTRKIVLQ